MGIKGINKFLEDNGCGSAFYTISLDNFSKYRIAIDACGYFHKILCSANKELILKSANPLEEIDKNLILEKAKKRLDIFIEQLCNLAITPIFVWDGTKIRSKSECTKKRIEKKNNIKNEVDKLREELENLHILYRDKNEIKKFKDKLVQYNVVTSDDLNFFKEYLTRIGFPNINAKHEGEKLCSYLATKGLVAAVWSVDTDNYALGTPILITDVSGFNEIGQIMVNVVDLRIILKTLNKPHSWLVDLCIMCGCDFNTNIPNIGPKKSYNLLEKYGSVENIESFGASKKDEDGNKVILTNEECLEILNYEECRDIFLVEDELEEKDILFDFNYEMLSENYELVESNNKLLEAINVLRHNEMKKSPYTIIATKKKQKNRLKI